MPTRQELLDSLRSLAEQMMESLRMMLTIVFAMTTAISPELPATEMESSPINQLIQEVTRQRSTIEQLGNVITQQLNQQQVNQQSQTQVAQMAQQFMMSPPRNNRPHPSRGIPELASSVASSEWNFEGDLDETELPSLPIPMPLPTGHPSSQVPCTSTTSTMNHENQRTNHGRAGVPPSNGPPSGSRALAPTGGALEQWGRKTITWGTKHPGRTYRDVYEQDQGYVRWVLARPNATGDIIDFFNYATARKALEDSVRASAGPSSAAP